MLIVIEGCIGAGKSTVAKGLAALRRSELLLEAFEENPFLQSFYKDPESAAVETEFCFLLLHFHQLKTRLRTHPKQEIIADFSLPKDLLYADLNLSESRFKTIFAELFQECQRELAQPALMVCLNATDNLIRRRILSRARDFEQDISFEYFERVNAMYRLFFHKHSGKKIEISMDDWDFVESPDRFQQLSRLIDTELDDRE